MIRKSTKKTIEFTFFSLNDLYNTVTNSLNKNKKTLAKEFEIEVKKGLRTDFIGCTYKEIMDRKFSWPEGVKRLKELSEANFPITKEYTKRWSDEDGDDMDFERFLNELPFLQKRVAKTGKKVTGNTVQKIVVNPCENSNISAAQMLWKTFTVAKIADELENNGVRCEIELKYKSVNIDSLKRTITITVPIKRAEEPLNLGLLCTAFAPWILRYWFFSLFFSCINNVNRGLGNASKIKNDDFNNCIVIDSGAALSKEQANNFIKNLNYFN